MERSLRRLRNLQPLGPSPAAYQPVPGDSLANSVNSISTAEPTAPVHFSWFEYGIFTLLGVAMLWAWNMFLAAAPYFQFRFAESEWLLTHFQSAILTMFNVTNVACSWVLAKMQRNASYPRRIVIAMVLSMISTTLLAISTNFTTSAVPYFGFLMAMVFIASLATAFCQNGLLAFASSFGNTEYTQAIMTGQGIAGVLPCIVQIAAELSVSELKGETADQEDPRSAFVFFITATAVVGGTLIAFVFLLRRNADRTLVKALATDGEDGEDGDDIEPEAERKVVGMLTLLNKLRWFALGVMMVFLITMVYPVFSQAILSVRNPDTAPRLFQPAAFIPLAFLIWNTGDLIGRMLPAWPRLSGIQHPKAIFIAAIARVVFIPLYELCNIKGRGAVVKSDAFYLVVVQLLFGMTGGYIGSTCMMAAPHWVEPGEREAAGGFMGLMLVFGLTLGSLMSFTISQA